ncbi:hypothetical protein DB032_12420 [Chromobacterium sp. Panama]|uniref:DEAD/DEAH box helicase n=1 Tax=Chromobacterium sp. Panama TaxID=2161826 RepID=UPI000D2FAAB8|nr:DEAD/DEAH box helicase [Chromobacterium sp. Panama]PTU65684.1 hypothetical protein DB032_12420 [Chromobacterium sp. Panama]
MKNDITLTIDRIVKKQATHIEIEQTLIKVYRLLDSIEDSDYNLCIRAICHIANMGNKDPMIKQLLHDNITKSRIFLYDNLLQQQDSQYLPQQSVQDSLLKSLYTSHISNTTLTKPQKEIFDTFQKNKRLIVSAPTSFGKTRIVQEIISHNNYTNIAIIVPTVSLLSEQYHELRDNISGYTITKSSKTNINPDSKYILVLTPERLSAFIDENPNFIIDFFVMDEIYKVDFKLEDERFRIFADVLYRLAKSKSDFYLIGPYISNFSSKFQRSFNTPFIKFNTEIVQKDFYDISSQGEHFIEGTSIKSIKDNFKNLIRILNKEEIDGKFLIYRYQKRFVEDTAKKLAQTIETKTFNTSFIEYLEKMISPQWNLISCIKKGIGFHHGGMPRYIQDLIVDEFNKNDETGLNYLICTTSLTEGVNTSAKNVILYDTKIGTGKAIGSLDRKNIEGRAGRFMRHFVGRVFYFEKVNIEETSNTDIEIEFFEDPNPAIEATIQLDEEDLSEIGRQKNNSLKLRLKNKNIPLELLKSNKFISIEGQISLIQALRSSHHSLEFSSQIPNKATTKLMLSYIYDHLFSEKDISRNFREQKGKDLLLQLTSFYLYHSPSFSELLNSDTLAYMRKEVDSRIRLTFELISKYFEFTWPKYLKSFQNLYNHVAKEKNSPQISLELMIAKLEYGTIKNHEIILKDSGIPNEIVRKISHHFSDCFSFEEIQNKKTTVLKEIINSIHPIEAVIIKKYL